MRRHSPATREVCGDRIEEDHDTDDGTYTTQGQTLRFLDDDGRENSDRGWASLTVKLADGTALLSRR